MAAIAFVLPILPGKEQTDKDFLREAAGPRKAELQESRRRLGITREAGWHQQTPQGTLAIIYIEADDPQRVFQGIATSTEPFDQWFRERAMEVHGVDLTQPMPGPLSEPVLDERF
jgi:hypothetical protein